MGESFSPCPLRGAATGRFPNKGFQMDFALITMVVLPVVAPFFVLLFLLFTED